MSARLGTKKSKECREKVKELKESQAAESVADRGKIRRIEKSSKAPEKQRNCDRPSERSNEFETERSLERYLGGVVPSAQKPRKSGYARVRPVKIGMFSSSTAARRPTEVSTIVTLVVRTLKFGRIFPEKEASEEDSYRFSKTDFKK